MKPSFESFENASRSLNGLTGRLPTWLGYSVVMAGFAVFIWLWFAVAEIPVKIARDLAANRSLFGILGFPGIDADLWFFLTDEMNFVDTAKIVMFLSFVWMFVFWDMWKSRKYEDMPTHRFIALGVLTASPAVVFVAVAVAVVIVVWNW